MRGLIRAAICLQLLGAVALHAQQRAIKVAGDTSGATAGCGTAEALAAITGWFVAFQAADSAGLARFSATRSSRGFVVTMGKFTTTDPFVRLESLEALLAHPPRRPRHHERLRLQGVRFYGWRKSALRFMPYFMRSADDLGPSERAGFGKAEYQCGQGVTILNLGPRPPGDPGL